MDKLGFFAAPGRYVQGRNATAQLGSLLQKLAIPPPVLILASKVGACGREEGLGRQGGKCQQARASSGRGGVNRWQAMCPFARSCPLHPYCQSGRRHLDEVWQATLPAAGYSFEVLQFGGESTVAEIERVAAVARASGAKAVIG